MESSFSLLQKRESQTCRAGDPEGWEWWRGADHWPTLTMTGDPAGRHDHCQNTRRMSFTALFTVTFFFFIRFSATLIFRQFLCILTGSQILVYWPNAVLLQSVQPSQSCWFSLLLLSSLMGWTSRSEVCKYYPPFLSYLVIPNLSKYKG